MDVCPHPFVGGLCLRRTATSRQRCVMTQAPNQVQDILLELVESFRRIAGGQGDGSTVGRDEGAG